MHVAEVEIAAAGRQPQLGLAGDLNHVQVVVADDHEGDGLAVGLSLGHCSAWAIRQADGRGAIRTLPWCILAVSKQETPVRCGSYRSYSGSRSTAQFACRGKEPANNIRRQDLASTNGVNHQVAGLDFLQAAVAHLEAASAVEEPPSTPTLRKTRRVLGVHHRPRQP